MAYLSYEPTSESIKYNRQGPTATLKFLVPWSEAEAFCLDAIGGFLAVAGSPVFFTPLAYQSDSITLFCNDAAIEGVDYEEDGSGWRTAEVTLTFGKLDMPEKEEEDDDPTQIAEYTYQLNAEELLLPKEGLHVGTSDGPAPDDEIPNPILIVPTAELSASYPFKPKKDAAVWKDYVGKVNGSAWKGHDAETVMFMGPRTSRTRFTYGKDAYSYDLAFQVKYVGWNKIYKPATATWVALHPQQYETADFDDLLSAI